MAFDEQAQEFEIDVFCSKGTYIRSLADDIGRALGCGAAMSALRRSYAAGFFLEDCVTLDALAAFRQDGALSQCIIPLERALGTDRAASTGYTARIRIFSAWGNCPCKGTS